MVPASPNFIAIVYESNTEGTNFRIIVMFVCFYIYEMCMFCNSPEVTLRGWRGYHHHHRHPGCSVGAASLVAIKSNAGGGAIRLQ